MSANAYRLTTIFAFLFSMVINKSYSQDTIITYETATGNVSYSLLPPYNTAITADSTPAFFGIYGTTAMPLSPPTDTFPYTHVSRPFKAADYYTSFNFPFTAVTSIRYGLNITAAVIGPHALLVSTYDVFTPGPQGWRGFYDVRPCFENGATQYIFSRLTALRFYILSPLLDHNFAIIEVAENIGDYSGYFGLAFDTSSQAYSTGHLLYNISYPKEGYPTYYSDSVNGDTLYMKYGYADNQPSRWYFNFGYYGGNGEYVSPYFDKDFRIWGQRWSMSANTKMTAKYFYFLKHILGSIPSGLTSIKENEGWNIYPNPATNQLICHIKSPSSKTTLQVLSIDGKLITSIQHVEQERTEINVSALPAGFYFLVLQDERQRVVKKFVKE